uniref:Secreted protein n=2 Tax=Opuntia streptacantha TaxID=393608 RepID=A0A7C9EU16_OPUST
MELCSLSLFFPLLSPVFFFAGTLLLLLSCSGSAAASPFFLPLSPHCPPFVFVFLLNYFTWGDVRSGQGQTGQWTSVLFFLNASRVPCGSNYTFINYKLQFTCCVSCLIAYLIIYDDGWYSMLLC